MNRTLLSCGVLAALVYVGTDLLTSALYPHFSFTDQAVSELFAIGAPTSRLVVSLFSLSSSLLLLFAIGVWRVAGSHVALRVMSVMFAIGAVNALVLWNLFPMHMRGQPRDFTDHMHLILAANPCVPLSLVAASFHFKGWYRGTSIVLLGIIVVLAFYGFRFAPALDANQATPGLGLIERAAQYSYQAWQISLAVMLARRARRHGRPTSLRLRWGS